MAYYTSKYETIMINLENQNKKTVNIIIIRLITSERSEWSSD